MSWRIDVDGGPELAPGRLSWGPTMTLKRRRRRVDVSAIWYDIQGAASGAVRSPAIRWRTSVMTIDRYDPLKAPDAKQWLATDEGERIQLALEYHTRARVKLPNATMHATVHVIVENQIALGDETPVRLKASQLMAQGLDRHEAIHAIASVLIGHLTEVMKN